MSDNKVFIDFHEALMNMSHSQDFTNDHRENKLSALTRLCCELLGVDRVGVWKLSPDGQTLINERLTDSKAANPATESPDLLLEREHHPHYFEALASARIIEAPDAQNDQRTHSFSDQYLKPNGIVSMLDAPIFDCGHLGGVLCLENRTERTWTLPEISFVSAIADTISLINTHEAWVKSKQKLDYLTHHDALTGLSNLQSLQDRVDYLIRKINRSGTGSFAMIWVDLDRLKAINDGLGPKVGDQVIAETGNRLAKITIPGKDQLARIGGDEFAMIVRKYTSEEALAAASRRILANIALPITSGDQTLAMSASLGICRYPGDGNDPETLLRSAEAAMYFAKTQGLSQARQFDTSIQTTARSRFALERELRAALRNDSLDVFYQPIFSAADQSMVNAEALVRWNHPERGMLAPIEFLDVARGAGLMYQLGECVLRRVCRDRKTAMERQLMMPPVSINLAAEQVLDPDLPALVSQVCKDSRIPQSSLHFEVTEDSMQGDPRTLQATLERLVRGGSELAIDDFGTGYSSLSRLKHLPFSMLKIDRSFVMDIPNEEDDCAITLSIIGLARGLGLSIVAEGVETQHQEQWLKAQGCEYLQGYLYSKPVPFEALAARFLANTSSDFRDQR
ncbi:sensor domain-containing phosphodiesterase [Marinobacter caseinilyticus]|uniref:sensor domain-containing phosphodiesterase n=1 Tax=Marinobacter caseinilyticus TaxID=2692195 RepID=UPI00140A0DBA|nr:sensor domain-containing phosphodiesterase [Marinobacter caseinilyticus]